MEPSEQTIFDTARQIPDAQARAVYLEQACTGDAKLRERVEKLLNANQRADEFLAADPLGLGQVNRQTILVAPLSEGPGTVIGNYKLLEKLGEGGFGVVSMAEQKQPIKRRVALKIIKVGMDTREVVARFEVERQALALMDHPNIAKVHDAGATETGRPYFVMELVRGIKITDYCDQKCLSARERLVLFTQVCQAVQHAHQKGIIHRDLKPSNILVTVNDGIAVPKIIDFGIAKATQMELTEKTVFTRFHQFLGTPAYMSPEQTEITSVDIDTRSDIYSLGVLLYELLTGRTPFDANELLKAGLDEMRRTIREQEPDRPSTRVSTLRGDERTTTAKRRGLDAPKLVDVLRGDLDWIVMKCLEKDRARRYETANGLASDIQRHLNSEPVIACPPSNLYKFRKLLRRNQLTFAAGASIAAALVIGLALALWQSMEKTRAYRRAQTEATRSQQVARFLEAMLEGIGPSKAKGRDTEMLREILDKMTERIGRELTDQPEVEASLRLTIGSAYLHLGQYEKAETVLRRALAINQKLYPHGGRKVAATLNDLAVVLTGKGKFNEGEEMLRRAIEIQKDSTEKAKSLANLGDVLEDQGKQAEAEQVYAEALRLVQKHEDNYRRSIVSGIRVKIASLLLKQGKVLDAETAYRAALKLKRQLYGDEDTSVAVALNGLGKTLVQVHKFEEAEDVLRRALAINRKLLGDEHPETASSLENLAALLKDTDKLAEAEDDYREALRIRRKALGDEHPSTASARNNLATALVAQDKLAEAEVLFREALVIQTKLLGREHPENAVTLVNLGSLLEQRGQPAQGEAFIREGLDLGRKLLGNEHPNVANFLHSLAQVLITQRKDQEAEPLEREALAIREKVFGAEDPGVAEALGSLAKILSSESKLSEAEVVLRRQLDLHRKSHGDDARTGVLLAELAERLSYIGKKSEASRLASEALALSQKFPVTEEDSGHVLALAALVEMDEKKYIDAETHLRQAIALEQKAGNELAVQTSRHHLAGALAKQGRWEEAITLERENLAFSRRVLGSDHPNVAAALNDLASWLVQEGVVVDDDKRREAEKLQREAVEIWRKRGGNGNDFGLALNNLGVAVARRSKADAVPILREAIELSRTNADWSVGNRSLPYNSLGKVLADMGKLSEAEAVQSELVAKVRKSAPDDPSMMSALAELAVTLIAEGKFAEAEPIARECLELRRQKTADEWTAFSAQILLGESLLGLKRYSDAESLLLAGHQGVKERKKTARQALYYRRQPGENRALELLAQLYEDTGRPDQAAEWKQKLAEFQKAAAPPKADDR